MPYLIDSDVLIYFTNDTAGAQTLIERLLPAGAAMSVIGYMEAVEGLPQSRTPRDAQARFESLVQRMTVMDLTIREVRRCADLRAALRIDGRRVRSRSLDLLVAATALEHNLTLVTNNAADYQDILGLDVLPAQITS